MAAGCSGGGAAVAAAGDAASKVYVAPGQKDEFYLFTSGGFSGNLGVYGLPSGRLFQQIPVFSQYPEKGYGYSEQSKALLNTSHGFIPWDDTHHPKLSQTAGVPDGRWLFINGNNTPRIARIDLSTMETVEVREVPNSAGMHASPFLTENTEYVVGTTRFSVPTPQADVPIDSYKENFAVLLSFVNVDSAGHMALAFQIKVPGYNYDLAHAGKGPSHGWAFFTSYNSEQASTLLEKGEERVEWHELKLGVYYRHEQLAHSETGRGLLSDKTVVAWQDQATELGRRLNWEALQAGLGRAQKLLYLGDGAQWVWNHKQDRWNSAIELLDFYHGSEHLWNLGRALHGERQPALSRWVEPLLHRVRHGKEKQALHWIGQLHRPTGQSGQVVQREQNYFKTHSGRMNYQQIARQGWPIGSGAVESACRQKQCRFKRCGQFWTKQGLRNLCALDEARRNHHWDGLWSPN